MAPPLDQVLGHRGRASSSLSPDGLQACYLPGTKKPVGAETMRPALTCINVGAGIR